MTIAIQARPTLWRLRAALVAVGLALAAAATVPVAAAGQAGPPSAGTDPLGLDDVLVSVQETYPPLLAAQIERDIRQGRLRSARSIFDFDLFGSLKSNVDGYYEYNTVEAGAEQFLGLWGSTVYGGYRLTTGETLPDYYGQRTQGDGEAAFGVRIPLLRGGAIDPLRGGVRQAELDTIAARPIIDRQRLDFIRAGTVAYWKWVSSGQKLLLARELLRVAEARTAALEEQVGSGLQPEIALVDNQRLVVSRELGVIEAERDFQAASLALSLFYRDANGEPITPSEAQVPGIFPQVEDAPEQLGDEAVRGALLRRPELARLRLSLARTQVDRDVAANALLPNLDATAELARNFGDELYVDRTETEFRVGLSLKLPVQRRSARGKVEEADAKLNQARRQLSFARDRVVAEVRETWVELNAAFEQTLRAELNVQLALELQAAEQELFRLGSSDLLAVQIREQAAFDAQSKAVEAYLAYYTALADLDAATAAGVDPVETVEGVPPLPVPPGN
jgi:outer membrane protein TolC